LEVVLDRLMLVSQEALGQVVADQLHHTLAVQAQLIKVMGEEVAGSQHQLMVVAAVVEQE